MGDIVDERVLPPSDAVGDPTTDIKDPTAIDGTVEEKFAESVAELAGASYDRASAERGGSGLRLNAARLSAGIAAVLHTTKVDPDDDALEPTVERTNDVLEAARRRGTTAGKRRGRDREETVRAVAEEAREAVDDDREAAAVLRGLDDGDLEAQYATFEETVEAIEADRGEATTGR